MIPVSLLTRLCQRSGKPARRCGPVYLCDQIVALTGSTKEDLPERFSHALCSSGRILIIVDSLSEPAMRAKLWSGWRRRPFRYVVLTSRTDERAVMKHVAPSRLQPIRLQGHDWGFVRSYLLAVRRDVRFSDRELMQLCERLSDMAGDRDITAMLATMYAAMAVTLKRRDGGPSQPQDIPALMLEYVKQISEKAGLHELAEHRGCSIRAEVGVLERVRETLRPRPLPPERLYKALAAEAALPDDPAGKSAALDRARTA